jgi:hypothetical protein
LPIFNGKHLVASASPRKASRQQKMNGSVLMGFIAGRNSTELPLGGSVNGQFELQLLAIIFLHFKG